MTNEQQNLLNHLNAIKIKTEAWVAEDPQNRWACYPVVDLAHWASYGVTTVEQYEHHCLVAQAFEATRDAFGYKPSWSRLLELTDEQLRKEIEFLKREIEYYREVKQKEELVHKKAVAEAMTHRSGFSIGELLGA